MKKKEKELDHKKAKKYNDKQNEDLTRKRQQKIKTNKKRNSTRVFIVSSRWPPSALVASLAERLKM